MDAYEVNYYFSSPNIGIIMIVVCPVILVCSVILDGGLQKLNKIVKNSTDRLLA